MNVLRRIRITPRNAGLFALVLVTTVACLRYPGFASPRVAAGLIGDNGVVGIAAVAVTLVLIAGGIDLSVGAVVALASVALALLIEQAGWHPYPAMACVLAGGATLGAAMGCAVHFLRLPSFLATLAGMFFARGLALTLHEGALPIRHPDFRELSASALPLPGGGASLPLPGLLFLVVAVAAQVVLSTTTFGRNVYAIGSDREAARLLGVPVRRTRIGVHAVSGALAALGGVAFALYGSAGNPAEGVGLELEAIAAAVVGGVALTGGAGSVAGAVVGVAVFGVIQLSILFEGTLAAGWTRVASGGLLLVFLGLERLLARRGRYARSPHAGPAGRGPASPRNKCPASEIH